MADMDIGGLPAGMVRLPDGMRLPLGEFMARHGAELAAYPEAEIGLLIPAWEPSEGVKDLAKYTVNAATALLAAAVVRNPSVAKYAGGAVGAMVAGYITRHLATRTRNRRPCARPGDGDGLMGEVASDLAIGVLTMSMLAASEWIGRRRGWSSTAAYAIAFAGTVVALVAWVSVR